MSAAILVKDSVQPRIELFNTGGWLGHDLVMQFSLFSVGLIPLLTILWAVNTEAWGLFPSGPGPSLGYKRAPPGITILLKTRENVLGIFNLGDDVVRECLKRCNH